MNLHKGFSVFNRRFVLPDLRTAIHQVAADIVFLQEVVGVNINHAERYRHWPNMSQYEYLADTVWDDFAYGRNAAYPEGHHGNALLSRFPIISQRNLDASSSHGEKRGLLHCCVEVPHTALNIHAICVHLGLREKHRRQQLDMLLAIIHEVPSSAPIIIAGDFNDWRLLSNDRLLRNLGFSEVFVTAHGLPAPTFPSRWPLLRLDRIYVRNARATAPINLPARPWSHLSDHVPLAGEITLAMNVNSESCV